MLLFEELVNHWTLCILFFNYVACLCICVCTWSFQKMFHKPSSTCTGNYNVGESNAIGVCEATFVPLLPVLQGDYAWKHKCYWWKINANVLLDVRLCL
jgi:hypothetical protein